MAMMRSDDPALHGTPSARRREPLLRATDAAQILAVRPSWIYEAVRERRLPCIRVGRHIRFTQSMLDQWVAEHVDA